MPFLAPDFNPIEEALSRLNAIFRKIRARTDSDLWELVASRANIFQPHHGVTSFSSSGYDLE